MKPFIVNRHGRLVFPSNAFVDLDFAVFDTLEQYNAVIRRDFDAKAPTERDIVERVESGAYTSRFELLRDLALHLFWVNRYALTMYEKRPTRWRDVPRHRADVFMPVLTPTGEGEGEVGAVQRCFRVLPPRWDGAVEDRLFGLLFDVYRHKRHDATELCAIKPTVAEMLADPSNRTFVLPAHDPDYPVVSAQEIIDYQEAVPELEALGRWATVIRRQYPWDQSTTRLGTMGEIGDDEFVVLFHPRSREVLEFIRRVKEGRGAPKRALGPVETRPPLRSYPPVEVRRRFDVWPRIEAIAAVKGELVCTNDDLLRNAAPSWSPMSAEEIVDKTGIEQRCYTERQLEHLALDAARGALAKAGRRPEEIGAVLFCSCTSARLIPSVATRLSGELGMFQTHASYDLVAACAGLPYGLAEALRLLQEVERPVLVICAEKFSDKIGNVRTSRMIFGDGAAALVIGPAPPGSEPDVEVVQTYASGPVCEVNSIIWPNPEFDNNITVYGPDVQSLVKRYLTQMMTELNALPGPNRTGSLLDAVELVVPHQANRTMVTKLATAAGFDADRLYFDIDRVGNVSAASIPLAIHDAVLDGVIDRPMMIFAPGFGAGAVAGYAVMRIDPANVVAETTHTEAQEDDTMLLSA